MPLRAGSCVAHPARQLSGFRVATTPLASPHIHGIAPMDSDGRSGASAHPHDYSQLNNEQLRSAIRFAEKRLCWVEEDHVTLLRVYRDEIDAMRQDLIGRVITRMITAAAPLSDEQRHNLHRVFERRAMSAEDVARLIRAATKGRVDKLVAMKEKNAMALLLRVEREA